MTNTKKPVALIILDGWGYSEDKEHNAIAMAQTPFFDYLWQTYYPTLLQASGEAVGLPDGQMGNSEVGHTTIGSGQIVYTDLARISKCIQTDELKNNPTLIQLFDHVKKYDSVLHIQGLIGPGGIHSHSEHLFALLKTAKENGINKIAIHAFTDGRDTPPQSAWFYLKELEDVIDDLKIGFIATASGRFYAMDRDNNWDRLVPVEKALFSGEGNKKESRKPSEVIKEMYEHGVLDEQLEPIIFLDDQGNNYTINNNDGVFFFNFRADRAKMISQKIIETQREKNIFFATMTSYGSDFNCPVAFSPIAIETNLAKEISVAGLSQAHIAETEKFAHATYFLNGGEEKPYDKEEHVLISSRKDIKTHDEAPEMKAEAIADKAIEQIEKGTDFIFINFANPDMIGHTANFEALVASIEFLDNQLKRVIEKILSVGGTAFITADHGNAELNIDPETGNKHTAHTTNLVPAILTDKNYDLRAGGLSDVAPTILELLNLAKPKVMTGHSLLTEKIIDSNRL
ncbi:MAG: 2,3-bisphosphoglycerate-independent phosphoglycerate mutase [bacterium]